MKRSFILVFISLLTLSDLLATPSIKLEAVSGNFPGRSDYIAPGGSITLTINSPANTTVEWYRNNEQIAVTQRGRLSLNNLNASASGNYQAIWLQGESVQTSTLLPINIGLFPRSNFTDPTFLAGDPHIFLSTTLNRVLPDNRVVANTSFFHLHSNDLLWNAALDENVAIRIGTPSPLYAKPSLLGVLDDGSYLLSSPLRIYSDPLTPPESFAAPAVFDFDAIKAVVDHGNNSMLLMSIFNLVGLSPDSTRAFSTTAEALGLASFHRVISLPDGKIAVHGSLPVTPGGSIPGSTIRLLPNGEIDPSFVPISTPSGGTTPVLLADGSWARILIDRQQRLDSNGSPMASRALPTESFGSYLEQTATGDVYGYFDGFGIVRYRASDLELDSTFFLPQQLQTLSPLKPLLSRPNGTLVVVGGNGDPAQRIVEALPTVEHTNSLPMIGTKVSVRTESPFGEGPRYFDFVPNSQDRPRDGASFELFCPFFSGEPATVHWIPLDGTEAIPPTNSGSLIIPSFSISYAGRYQLVISNQTGSTYGPIADLRPRGEPRLTNLSGRARVDSGDRKSVAGFVLRDNPNTAIDSTPTAQLLLRGIGPTLAEFGVTQPLLDPVLHFSPPNSESTVSNDNWGTLTNLHPVDLERLGAFTPPATSADAALFQNAPAGAYVVSTEAKTGQAGVALTEIYLDDQNLQSRPRLVNLSLRGYAGNDENTMVGGFVIEDPDNLARPLQVLIRAVGPTLTSFGVSPVMSDPILKLYNVAGDLIATNDNWHLSATAAQIAAQGAEVGAFALPAQSLDAALILTLAPGTYTAQVSPRESSEGIALLEIYRVPLESPRLTH